MVLVQPGLIQQLNVAALAEPLTTAERRVVEWVLEHPEKPLNLSVGELAAAAGVSEATVVRTCQRIGYAGYPQFKLALAADLAQSSRSDHPPVLIGDVKVDDPLDVAVRKVFGANIQILTRSLEALDMSRFDAALTAILRAKRLEVFSAGIQAHLVHDVCAKFISTGIPCAGRADHLQQLTAAALMEASDVLLIFSHSGRVKVLIQAAQLARVRGATTIAITNFPQSRLAKSVDIALITHGQDATFCNEAMGSQVVQMVLIDCLLVGIASRRDQVLSNIVTARKAVEEYRP